jgi:hypothetical protein
LSSELRLSRSTNDSGSVVTCAAGAVADVGGIWIWRSPGEGRRGDREGGVRGVVLGGEGWRGRSGYGGWGAAASGII